MKRYLYCAGILLSSAITSVQATDIQGLWKENGSDGSYSNWVIGVNNGVIYGSSYWYGDLIDKLEGTVSGNTVSVTRYLREQGKTQTYTVQFQVRKFLGHVLAHI